jgi:hypothetical protein
MVFGRLSTCGISAQQHGWGGFRTRLGMIRLLSLSSVLALHYANLKNTSQAMEPSFFKMMIWHKRDPQSGFRHQILNFEIPDLDRMRAKTKHAEIYAIRGNTAMSFSSKLLR